MIAGFVIACVVLVVFGVLALLVAPFERRRPLPPPNPRAVVRRALNVPL